MHRVKRTIYIRELILLIITLILCIACPKQYSFGWCLTAFLITLYSVAKFFIKWKQKGLSFLNFEPIFILVALVMGFTMPIFIYNGDPNTLYIFSWNIPFSSDYVNKGAFATALGILSFILGNLSFRENKRQIQKTTVIINKLMIIILVFCLLSFIIFGGFEYYQLVYNGEGETKSSVQFLEVFIIALSQLLLFNELWNKTCNDSYRCKRVNILLPIVVSILFGLVGNRTVCLYFLLPAVFYLSQYLFKISFFPFILLVIIGGSVMVLLLFFRSGYDMSKDYDWFYFLIDLLNPNTTTYLAFEIVDKNSFTFGLSELGGILGFIPFAQSIFYYITGVSPEHTNSSNLFTHYLDSPAGTGTNFISSSYLAFGLLGIVIISFMFGKIIQALRTKSVYSYYYFLTFYIVCGFAVYGVRSSLFYPLRFIFYCLLFAYINKLLNKYLVYESHYNNTSL